MVAVLRDEYSVRPMRLDDVDAILAIEQRSYPFPWSAGIFQDCIKVGYHCLVMEVDGAVAGYTIFSVVVQECHILNICIDPRWRRSGLARRLLDCIFERAGCMDAGLIYLEVRPTNTAAINLYASLGFEQIARRRRYYPTHDGREDALVLARAVSP
jgi:ribosomal-protein-alanine N-acetyltransferase